MLRAGLSLAGVCVAMMVAGCASAPADESASEAQLTAPPSQDQLAMAQTLWQTIDAIEANTGVAPFAGVDTHALYTRLEAELFASAPAPISLVKVLRKATLAYPSGHLGFALEGGCVVASSSSTIGACSQPYRDHAVVSFVSDDNPVGLLPGDEILSVNGRSGAQMMQAALEQPMCTVSSASESNRRFTAGTSLFAMMTVGAKVEVRHLDGTVETKTVERLASRLTYCRDPLGRSTAPLARAYMRPDNIGVVQLSSLSMPVAEGEDMPSRLREVIRGALEQVKSAQSIIWDLRANTGGSSINGIEIFSSVGDAPNHAGEPVVGFSARVPSTNFYPPPYMQKLSPREELAYGGKVAILLDGLSISAADYTAVAAKQTHALVVGSPSSGSYGGGSQHVTVGDRFKVNLRTDPYRALDASGAPVEGKGTEPDVEVELEPADLARGVDTVMEAAAARLK
jgi:C-terminal processing protease CtpA/Prc